MTDVSVSGVASRSASFSVTGLFRKRRKRVHVFIVPALHEDLGSGAHAGVLTYQCISCLEPTKIGHDSAPHPSRVLSPFDVVGLPSLGLLDSIDLLGKGIGLGMSSAACGHHHSFSICRSFIWSPWQ